jgi:hypothetical protein
MVITINTLSLWCWKDKLRNISQIYKLNNEETIIPIKIYHISTWYRSNLKILIRYKNIPKIIFIIKNNFYLGYCGYVYFMFRWM